jgi:glycosyltransferase involved in cell wall biosynthesis
VAEHFGIPKEKLCFWRNGVECPPECLLTSSDKIRIISLARLQDWKRVDRIITAFAYASLKNDKIVLDIVGGGLEEISLKNLVKKYDDLYYDIGHKIVFHGEVSRERALALLGCSDIFISTNDYSNISNSLMEAMSGSKGIIVLDTGKTSDIVDGTNGLLVDESKLSDAIIQLCNKDVRKLFGYNAHQYAIDHFESWKSRINKEIELYEDLIYKGG